MTEKTWIGFFSIQANKKEMGRILSDEDVKVVIFEWHDLFKYSFDLAQELIKNPSKAANDIKIALKQMEITSIRKEASKLTVRFIKFPEKIAIRNLRVNNTNSMVSIEGTVRKASDVMPKITLAVFECMRCGQKIEIPQTNDAKLIEPFACNGPNCDSTKKGAFRPLEDESRFIDFQRIKIQESQESLKGGEQPQTLDLNVQDDLVAQVVPGEHIIVNGIIRKVQKTNKEGKTVFYDTYMNVHSIEHEEHEFDEITITKQDEAEILRLAALPDIRQKIIASIAPSIYGFQDVKEAIALQLFGGVTKNLPDGSHIRGDTHILLIGDPGIAKTRIVRSAVELAPRSVFTSGKSASSAGLTAAAVKDDFDGCWTLEAGALVLADKGMAGIDEMDKMNANDRASLHEAMESGSVSVAKAGILAVLKCRCCILAAANPTHGKFNMAENISGQVNMPPSLLSRFDLIFILQDKPEEKKDGDIATHILNSHYAGEILADNGKIDDDIAKAVTPDIDALLLRKYIAYSKRNIKPILTKEARDEIKNLYTTLRSGGNGDNPMPITARQLEGIVRLSESSARMFCRKQILPEDVKEIMKILMSSMQQVMTDPETGKLDVTSLETGSFKSQRDRRVDLKNIIKVLSEKYGTAGIPLNDILSAAEANNINRDKAEKELRNMKEFGQVYEPRIGFFCPCDK